MSSSRAFMSLVQLGNSIPVCTVNRCAVQLTQLKCSKTNIFLLCHNKAFSDANDCSSCQLPDLAEVLHMNEAQRATCMLCENKFRV